jgi:ABC-2 type transport system ATP-binding protein
LIRQQPYVATAVSHDKRLSVELKEVVDPAPLVTLLVNRGVMVEEVRRGSASLEEVFLALMEEEGDE